MFKKVFVSFFLLVLIINSSAVLHAQGNSAPSLKWNHEAVLSFREPVKKEEVKDFLPYFPSKEAYAKSAVEVEQKYREDSVKLLHVFLKPDAIPNDLASQLLTALVHWRPLGG